MCRKRKMKRVRRVGIPPFGDPNVKQWFTMNVWGDWMGGRPNDSWFGLVDWEKIDDTLVLYFRNDAKMTFIKPIRVVWNDGYPTIGDAEKVIWEYHWNSIEAQYCKKEYTKISNSKVHILGTNPLGNIDTIIFIGASNSNALSTYR